MTLLILHIYFENAVWIIVYKIPAFINKEHDKKHDLKRYNILYKRRCCLKNTAAADLVFSPTSAGWAFRY
jgi:hypothetical protein